MFKRSKTHTFESILVILACFLCPFLAYNQSIQDDIRFKLSEMETSEAQIDYLSFLYHDTYYKDISQLDSIQYFLDSMGQSSGNPVVLAGYYNTLGFKYYNQRNVDSISYYYSKCLEVARPHNLYDHMIKSHRFIAMMGGIKKRFEDSYKHIDTARDLSKKHGNLSQLIETHIVHALILKDFQGLEDEANEINLQVDSIVIANDVKSMQAVNNKINLSNVTFGTRQYERSKAYSESALEMSTEIEFSYGVMASKCDLANLYVVVDREHDSLTTYGQQSFDYFKEYPITNLRHLRAHYVKGLIAKYAGETDTALYYLNYCRKIINKRPMRLINVLIYENLFELYIKEKNFQEAELVLEEYEDYCSKNKLERYCQYEPLKFRSTINYHKGNYKQALEEDRIASVKKDSFVKEDIDSKIIEVNTKYESEKKSKEIVALQLSNQKIAQEKKQQSMIFVVVVLLLSLLSLFGWFYYQNSKKTTQKLQELDQLKSDIFTNLSHELRTPLTLIKGITSKLLQGSISSSQRYDLKLIAKSSERLGKMINQLFDLSKVETAGKKLQVEKINAFKYILGLVANYGSMADEKNISLKMNVPKEDVDDTWLDKDMFDTILHNLLSNAFKYAKSEITVHVSIVDENIKVSVSDDGPGIPKYEQSKIFDRFYQVADKRKSGLGVGLSLVKELATLHLGSIMVESVEGQGARFTLNLPIHMDTYGSEHIKETEVARQETTNNVLPDEKDSILIIDDNQDIHYLLDSMLSKEYKIIKATNGKEGLEQARKHMPDLIISDLMMPIMDGYAFTKALRREKLVADIPIVMLTAKADLASKIEGLALGVDDYLVKPFDEAELNLKIKNFLLRRAQVRNKFHEQTAFKPKEIAINDQDAEFWQDLKAFLQKDLGNAELTIEGLAGQLGISRIQLFRKIKKSTGKSPSQFLEIQRLQWAVELLNETQLSVSEIAFQVGFGDTSYFTKRFKNFIGQTPIEFRS